jgi:hypothetical protein
MPDHQEKRKDSPGGRRFCAGEGLLMSESPEKLEDAGNKKREKHKQDQGWDIGIG